MAHITYRVDGMHCDGCAGRLQRLLQGAEGVTEAAVSFAATSAEIDYDEAKVGPDNLIQVIEAAGFAASTS